MAGTKSDCQYEKGVKAGWSRCNAGGYCFNGRVNAAGSNPQAKYCSTKTNAHSPAKYPSCPECRCTNCCPTVKTRYSCLSFTWGWRRNISTMTNANSGPLLWTATSGTTTTLVSDCLTWLKTTWTTTTKTAPIPNRHGSRSLSLFEWTSVCLGCLVPKYRISVSSSYVYSSYILPSETMVRCERLGWFQTECSWSFSLSSYCSSPNSVSAKWTAPFHPSD